MKYNFKVLNNKHTCFIKNKEPNVFNNNGMYLNQKNS